MEFADATSSPWWCPGLTSQRVITMERKKRGSTLKECSAYTHLKHPKKDRCARTNFVKEEKKQDKDREFAYI